MNLLNEANTDLKNNNVSFPFTTTLYSSNAAEFSKFNRALAARVAVYRQDWTTANTALSESFLNLAGDLKAGVYHKFSAAGGDELNPLFIPPNSPAAENRLAHPSFITDASANDNRVASKVSLRSSPGFQDGLQSNYDFVLYKTNVDPIPIIRNEELVLLYAEVKAQTTQLPEAVNAINLIRGAAGITPYAGAVTQAALLTEILRQRRYSLFGEGHRWIDLRRYNLLTQLPLDRPNDNVWEQFPRPANE
jgi:starch-binding outer membrane protein, SusD/RagB family